jgi:adenylate cyclase
MGLIIPKMSPAIGGVVMATTAVTYAVASLLIFAEMGWWFDTIGPMGVVVFGYLGITVRNYIVEEKEKKFIKGAFASYLAPEVVDQIADNPEGLKLGGEPVEITAFFSDLQKFSAISQDLTATQLVELLNEYLTEMCDIIIKYDGTVDKFEGDAIVAFFGAPIRYDDNAIRGCLASIEMQHKLAELRPKYYEVWGHNLLQRIGLNTGECVVGNMGSKSRFDYTMMGDNVNLAARLEESAKQYGIYLQISEATFRPAVDYVEARELDKTIVMGRSEPVPVYELLDKKGDLDPTMAKVRDHYQDGLYIYREQRWADAIEKFKLAIEASGEGDNPSNTMIGRCESLLDGSADVEFPKDWDGAWTLTSK